MESSRETGLEPATSGVTGRCSNRLNYSRILGRNRTRTYDRLCVKQVLYRLSYAPRDREIYREPRFFASLPEDFGTPLRGGGEGVIPRGRWGARCVKHVGVEGDLQGGTAHSSPLSACGMRSVFSDDPRRPSRVLGKEVRVARRRPLHPLRGVEEVSREKRKMAKLLHTKPGRREKIVLLNAGHTMAMIPPVRMPAHAPCPFTFFA